MLLKGPLGVARAILSQVAHMHVTPVPSHYCSAAVARAAERAAKRGKPAPGEVDGKVIYGCLRGIRVNPWKLNLVARQIRGLKIDDAIKQATFSSKECAKAIRQVLLVTKANAKYHSGVEDPSNMYVLESYVGKGIYGQGLIYKSKGRMSIADKPKSHYFLKLKEGARPVKPKREHPNLHTRRIIEQLYTRPQKIRGSLC